MRFGWLIAAAAALCAGQAQAADYLIYTFDVTGTAQRIVNSITGSPVNLSGPLTGQVIFDLPIAVAGQSMLSLPLNNMLEFTSDTYTGTATSDDLTITENAYTEKGPNRQFSLSACGAFGGAFPSASVAIDPTCSSYSFFRGIPLGIVGGDGASFNGTVTGLTVTDGFGTPTAYGLVQAPILPVPEPATWAMMILGMAAIGYSLRRRLHSFSAEAFVRKLGALMTGL